MTKMYERLFDIYDFIEAYKAKHGYSPSMEEIGEGVGIAKTTVFQHLETMENVRMIIRPRGMLRAIKLISREPDWDIIVAER